MGIRDYDGIEVEFFRGMVIGWRMFLGRMSWWFWWRRSIGSWGGGAIGFGESGGGGDRGAGDYFAFGVADVL